MVMHNDMHKAMHKAMHNHQVTLDGKVLIKSQITDNQFKILETFYLNSELAFSISQARRIWEAKMHKNTIENFFKKAHLEGWIKELKIIKGEVINNLFTFQKLPDRLENGQTISTDVRLKYYQVTIYGAQIYEQSLKCKDLIKGSI